MHLKRHLVGAVHAQDAARPVAVVDQRAVGGVLDDDDAMLVREFDQLTVETLSVAMAPVGLFG